MKNEQNNNTPPEAAAAPQKSGKCRWLKILLCLFAAGIVIFAGAAILLASAIFSEPKHNPLMKLQKQDFKLQQKMLRRLSGEIFRKKPRPLAKMTINAAEQQSLLRLLDNGLSIAKLTGKYNGIDLRDLEPEFSRGTIQFVYPLDTGYKWLFGGVIRIKIIAVPAFADKTLTVSLKECRIGKLPVPEKTAKQILDKFLLEFQKSPGFKKFCSLVKEIRLMPDGSLVIIYYPAELAPVLLFGKTV